MANLTYEQLTTEEMERAIPSGSMIVTFAKWPHSTTGSQDAAVPEAKVDCRSRITTGADTLSGKACIRGLSITVSDVLGCLASGKTYDEVLADFPELEREDILACLAFAADRER